MYRLAVLLLVATCASASLAQPARPSAPTPAASAPNQTGLTADGKIMLGLDGRGNYRKPRVARTARAADTPPPANVQAANASAFRQALQAPQLGMPPAQQPPSPSAAPLAPTTMQTAPVATVAPAAPATPVAPTTAANPAVAPSRPPVLPNALPALQPNGGLFTDAMR